MRRSTLEPVGVRQHHTQNEEGEVLRECPFHARAASRSPPDFEPFATQEPRDELPQFGIVVHHQHAFHGKRSVPFILKP